MSNKISYLHIGLPKIGMSFLQACLYSFHKYLDELIMLKKHSHPIVLRLDPVISKLNSKGPYYDQKQGVLFLSPSSVFVGVSISTIQSVILSLINRLNLEGIYNLCNLGSVSVKDLIEKFNLNIECIKENALIMDDTVSTNKIEKVLKLNSQDFELEQFFSGS